ncbi:hypothetical protein M427DRAFT_133879 [Gonapodya prolifera JEL478]|uniref:EamA domain-containing protein n=1 Tax=Gonapodya prolifera (strain JEL478) TaxID=1344416 RepID=A0A139AJX6_GONPJ|nr:hypothetical protein M427DRAFT_133879 [Gonapodya prolifera JEL478]|eukprot:KXS16803.1 hypothetical protein M427DRAFT_133879 [Gonapodya prolifera JEL478]
MIATSLSLIVVAFLWGATNPFLRIESQGLESTTKPQGQGVVGGYAAELAYLGTRWKYLLALGVNLSGSVLFYYLLSTADLSVTALVNALTFAFTSLIGWAFFGESISGRSLLGMCLVVVGVCLCVMSKIEDVK